MSEVVSFFFAGKDDQKPCGKCIHRAAAVAFAKWVGQIPFPETTCTMSWGVLSQTFSEDPEFKALGVPTHELAGIMEVIRFAQKYRLGATFVQVGYPPVPGYHLAVMPTGH